MRRVLRRVAIVCGGLVLACAAPIAWTEATCKAPVEPTASREMLVDARDHRAEGDSYLSYPEWAIVHAYADLAGVTRQSSESSFDYLAAIGTFWRSLCGATRTASSIGSATLDQRVTNYIIGLSFSAEMGLKGLWERTVGALSAWTRGPERTAEDEFALRTADEYAAFLHQTPWYQFPFAQTLERFWSDVPMSGRHPVRKWERRVALSLEWGGKTLYAKLMALLAGTSPADLTIRSIVRGLNDADRAAMSAITVVRSLGDDRTLIETPRYEAFTDILRGFATRGRDLVEIAGNRRILTTVVAQGGASLDTVGAREIFSLPIQSRPGSRRLGLDTDVASLTKQIGAVERQGATFEHAYDY